MNKIYVKPEISIDLFVDTDVMSVSPFDEKEISDKWE